MAHSTTLCRIGDLPDGGARGFDPGGVGRDTVFVVRRGEVLYGWLDRCPHEGDTPLPYRRHAYLDAKGTRIVCFAHGAQFDIATGECLIGPCVGQALTPVPLEIEEDGRVLTSSTFARRNEPTACSASRSLL
jgi:nitrite reductase/ring-hydroxylating ferredoxin subunit